MTANRKHPARMKKVAWYTAILSLRERASYSGAAEDNGVPYTDAERSSDARALGAPIEKMAFDVNPDQDSTYACRLNNRNFEFVISPCCR
jgi:hypothetical protein